MMGVAVEVHGGQGGAVATWSARRLGGVLAEEIEHLQLALRLAVAPSGVAIDGHGDGVGLVDARAVDVRAALVDAGGEAAVLGLLARDAVELAVAIRGDESVR